MKSILYQGLEKEEAGIPSTVKVIGDSAFLGCRLLARLVLNEGLERIGKNAFHFCEGLTEVEIPSTVKVIGDCAFYYCKLLARLVLSEGLERIGEDSFRECESLTEVNVPCTVKVIDICAFYGCKHLARLGLNEGLELIGKNAFLGCQSLSRVRIPQSVNFIATDVFVECSSMISIELFEECSFNIELSGCLSLVSVIGPISITTKSWEAEIREAFFQSSKLGCLVDDEADLKRKLNHRFDNSPLNKLCYYQSYESLDVAMAELRSLMEDDPLATTKEVDEFGMTPLHVLSLSQTTNLDMLLAVMDAGKPGHMVRVRDSFGSTPMDYLFLNRMPNSSEVIRRIFQTRFEQVLGLDKFWKSVMLQAIDKILAGDWASRKSETGRIIRKYERKEILSLVELFLWKMKNDEAPSNKKVKIGVATSKETQILADQQKRRFISGAAVVIPHVLLFLDTISSVSNEG
eukprot:scaffold3872_cov87-Cylindrotheca_fusiformis.AAC.1